MVPLVVVGAVTIAVAVTAQFFAVALISEAGGDAVAYLDAADDWFVPLFIAGGVIFGLGWLALAMSIYRSAVLSRELTTVVMIALIVVVAANFIPTGWGGYVLAIAAIVASWPLAYTMWPTAVGAPSVGGPASLTNVDGGRRQLVSRCRPLVTGIDGGLFGAHDPIQRDRMFWVRVKEATRGRTSSSRRRDARSSLHRPTAWSPVPNPCRPPRRGS